MADFTAAVYQNEFPPTGAPMPGDRVGHLRQCRQGRPGRQRGRRRDHHHRHIGLDGCRDDGGCHGRLRSRRSTRSSTAPGSRSSRAMARPSLPTRTSAPARAWSGWMTAPEARGPRHQCPQRGRRHRHLHVARPRGHALRVGPRGHPAPRAAPHRRREQRARLGARCRHQGAPPTTTRRTAEAPAPIGRSRRSAASRRPCSGRSTSSRSRPRWKRSSREIMRASMSRGVSDAQLRVWAPQGAQVVFVRQVLPTVEDLTARRTAVNDLTGAYPPAPGPTRPVTIT